MTEGLKIAIIAAASAVAGGLVGGAITIWSAKISADREDRRRREERERETAHERIENLYKPLVKALEPNPPYDDFSIHPETQKRIMDKIEKNELLASPELREVFWEFRYAYYDEPRLIDRELSWKIYQLSSSEYDRLKEIMGYGRILEKESPIKIMLHRIKSRVEEKIRQFRHNRFINTVKKRQARAKQKTKD